MPSPALEAGLKVGDTIRAIDGTKVADWPELLQTLVMSSGSRMTASAAPSSAIERDGQLIDLPVYPRLSGEDNNRRVGIIYAYTPIVASVRENPLAPRSACRPATGWSSSTASAC